MTYIEAKARADALHEQYRRAGMVMDTFPKGPMGLTPDEVKATPAYRSARTECDRAFAELRNFNGWYTKTFRRERRLERTGRPEGARSDAMAGGAR